MNEKSTRVGPIVSGSFRNNILSEVVMPQLEESEEYRTMLYKNLTQREMPEKPLPPNSLEVEFTCRFRQTMRSLRGKGHVESEGGKLYLINVHEVLQEIANLTITCFAMEYHEKEYIALPALQLALLDMRKFKLVVSADMTLEITEVPCNFIEDMLYCEANAMYSTSPVKESPELTPLADKARSAEDEKSESAMKTTLPDVKEDDPPPRATSPVPCTSHTEVYPLEIQETLASPRKEDAEEKHNSEKKNKGKIKNGKKRHKKQEDEEERHKKKQKKETVEFCDEVKDDADGNDEEETISSKKTPEVTCDVKGHGMYQFLQHVQKCTTRDEALTDEDIMLKSHRIITHGHACWAEYSKKSMLMLSSFPFTVENNVIKLECTFCPVHCMNDMCMQPPRGRPHNNGAYQDVKKSVKNKANP